MVNDDGEWASIGGRITHGTGTPFVVPSVLPQSKEDKETFWVRAVVEKLPEFTGLTPRIRSSPNDANGGPDVLIAVPDGDIGVQVTELTDERSRLRQVQTPSYVQKVLEVLSVRGVRSVRRLAVVCHLQDDGQRTYEPPPAEAVAAAVEQFLGEALDCPRVVPLGRATLLFTWADEGRFYIPSVGNIGFDTSVSELSRSPSVYRALVDEIVRKKSNALAPWLVIWSLSFWRDRHFCEDSLVEYMRRRFRDARFERVFFVDSMDGAGFFETNLRLRSIVPDLTGNGSESIA